MTDENNQSKGCGFVHLETQDAADEAINKVNSMLLGEKIIHVRRLMSSNQQVDIDEARKLTNNIFINNFGDQLDEEKLREILSKHGKVLSCRVNHLSFFRFCIRK